jgi:hypothetical protein
MSAIDVSGRTEEHNMIRCQRPHKVESSRQILHGSERARYRLFDADNTGEVNDRVVLSNELRYQLRIKDTSIEAANAVVAELGTIERAVRTAQVIENRDS